MWKLTKAILWLAIGIFCINFVSAIDICSRENPIRTNCTMLTPALNCTDIGYNYSIINISGAVIVNSTLTPLALDVWFLNFSQPKGNYIVRLCDGSTREVRVVDGEESNMGIISIIILLPMLLGFLITWGNSTLDGQAHPALKTFLFLLAPIMFIVSLHYAVIALVQYYEFPIMQEALAGTTYWFALIISVIIMYFLLNIIITAFKIAKQEKDTKMEY